MRLFASFACFAYVFTAIAGEIDAAAMIQKQWEKPPVYPPPRSPASLPPTDKPLNIHLMTIPAHGHYMTLRDVGMALAARGHRVSFVMCERNRKNFVADGLEEAGIGYITAGNCSLYDDFDRVMSAVIQNPSLESVSAMLDGVAELSFQMCKAVMPYYESAFRGYINDTPDVLVFDADTFCAMDISIRYKIPRIARVGTGPRDVYSTPFHIAQYGLAAPSHMTFGQRLKNALSILFSRAVISPFVLPALQAKYRAHWQTVEVEPLPAPQAQNTIAIGADGSVQDQVTDRLMSHQPRQVDPSEEFRCDIPWDGFPVLYNTHWGLDHPRPLQPFEHAIGHTTNFVKESQTPIPASLLSWLNAAADVPVVYVGMGTLSIIDNSTLARFATAFGDSKRARFLWSVPTEQQALLPSAARAHTAAWESGEGTPSAGSVYLASWVPQLAVLRHNMTRIFITHGGMNGVAEGTYAHTPMLCMPLFSDQPDNCQHIEDFEFGVSADPKEVSPDKLNALIDEMLDDASYQRSIQRAWTRNVAAGGIPRAVEIIETSAMLGYAEARHAVPQQYFLPWYQRHNVDIIGIFIFVAIALALCMKCVGGVCCRCRACRKEKVAV